MKSAFALSVLCGALSACDVPEPPAPTGGVPGLAEAGSGKCGRGFSVVESDYQSVNIALVSIEGDVLSESLATSAVESGGAKLSLSGDVVPVSALAAGPELPVLDRSAADPAIVWLSLAGGGVARRLSVATGFQANPHDFVQLSPEKAYVARFGHNHASGKEPFDRGSDLLIVDPRAGKLLGSLDLREALGSDAEQNLPRPEQVLVRDGFAYVLLGTLPLRSFTAATSSRLAVVDVTTDEIVSTLVLPDLRGCGGMDVSPDGAELAVFCSALTDSNGGSQAAFSGIALVSLSPMPKLLRTLRSELWGGAPIGFAGAYAASNKLLFTTFGRFSATGEAEAQDSLLELDLQRLSVEPLLESAGTPFTLGGVSCSVNCSTCVVADASRDGGVVHHYELGPTGDVASHAAVKVETRIGLPPRSIGRF